MAVEGHYLPYPPLGKHTRKEVIIGLFMFIYVYYVYVRIVYVYIYVFGRNKALSMAVEGHFLPYPPLGKY
jgi:hypothetical protein